MPRVAFFGYPARGHTAPSLPIVAELVSRGASVDYHSIPAFRTLIEEAGARFVAYPPACAHWLTDGVTSAEHLARVLATADEMLPTLLGAMSTPDLVLFDASALWGRIIARRLERPCVASTTTFAFSRAMLRMLAPHAPSAWSAPILARLNAEHDAGLQDHLDIISPTADLKLVYTARGFQPSGRFFDDSHLFLGPLLNQRPREGTRVETAAARPLAYVSLGTIFNRDHAMLRQISDVLAARGWHVVVSFGGANEASSQDWPEHVEAHAFVDQIGLLAQARLFVTHGGMNSVSEALSQAVPMIVIPQAVDQHLVGRQTANLGAAVVIEQEAFSAEALAAALARIEDNRAAFEAAATRLQGELSNVTPVSDAVNRALALISEEQSVA